MGGGDTEQGAVAGPAALQRQHQAGIFGRAAPHVQPQTEAPVPAVHGTGDAFGELQCRVPHQGSVAEQPDIGRRVVRRQRRVEVGLDILVGTEYGAGRCAQAGIGEQGSVAQTLAGHDMGGAAGHGRAIVRFQSQPTH